MRIGLIAVFCLLTLRIAPSSLAQSTEPNKFTGPGSCASPSCHGSVVLRTETGPNGIDQTEYSTWVIKDKHARAYAALSMPVGLRMGKILGLTPNPADFDLALRKAGKPTKCIACHTLDVDEAQKAKSFDQTDGVSCESCHGSASNWLGSHTTRPANTTRDAVHADSLKKGMIDLHDLSKRTEQCLTCHLGTAEKYVDHEMIGAGHPDLYFELASFTTAMPRHWRPRQEEPFLEVRTVAVGQATQLRDQLKRLARNARGDFKDPNEKGLDRKQVWPEYADLDCFACHHSLADAKDSWQQERGFEGRRAGNPPWNLSRFVVLKHVLNEVDANAGRQLAGNLNNLYAMVSSLTNDRNQIAAQADAAAAAADGLVGRVSAHAWNLDNGRRLMKAISGDTEYISNQGERPAEQAAMALRALFNGINAQSPLGNQAQVRSAIDALFKQVEDPSAYNAFKFASQLRAVNNLLP